MIKVTWHKNSLAIQGHANCKTKGKDLVCCAASAIIQTATAWFDKDDIEFGDYKYEEILTDLANIKTSYKPLYNGIYGGKVREIKEDNKSVIADERVKDGEKITLIANISNTKQTVKYSGTISYGDVLLHGKGEEIVSDKKEELNIKDLNERLIIYYSDNKYTKEKYIKLNPIIKNEIDELLVPQILFSENKIQTEIIEDSFCLSPLLLAAFIFAYQRKGLD